MNPLYPHTAHRALNLCEYCRAPEVVSNFTFEVEHIIPKAHGGTSDAENLALACHACNLHKPDALTGFDAETGQNVALFHPRRDSWRVHFQADFILGEIKGLTPTGRGTVARLQMNSRFQKAARLLWIRLSLFP